MKAFFNGETCPFYCSCGPLASWLGLNDDSLEEETSKKRRKDKKEKNALVPRSETEVETIVESWTDVLNVRSKRMDDSAVNYILETIARKTSRGTDCVIGENDDDVYWYGDVNQGRVPCLTFNESPFRTKNYEDNKPVTMEVTRLLAFLFAHNQSYDELVSSIGNSTMELWCHKSRCVKLTHIVLPH